MGSARNDKMPHAVSNTTAPRTNHRLFSAKSTSPRIKSWSPGRKAKHTIPGDPAQTPQSLAVLSSKIPAEKPSQAIAPVSGVASFYSQQKLCCSQLIAKVECSAGVCVTHQLEILLDLIGLLPERADAILLRGDRLLDLLAQPLRAPLNIALLHLFPTRVGADLAIEMLVDRAAAKVISDADLAVRFRAIAYRVELLMRADRQGNIPIILARETRQGALFGVVARVLRGHLLLDRLVGKPRYVERGNLRLRVGA